MPFRRAIIAIVCYCLPAFVEARNQIIRHDGVAHRALKDGKMGMGSKSSKSSIDSNSTLVPSSASTTAVPSSTSPKSKKKKSKFGKISKSDPKSKDGKKSEKDKKKSKSKGASSETPTPGSNSTSPPAALPVASAPVRAPAPVANTTTAASISPTPLPSKKGKNGKKSKKAKRSKGSNAPTSTVGTAKAPTSTVGTAKAPTSTVGTAKAPTSTAGTANTTRAGDMKTRTENRVANPTRKPTPVPTTLPQPTAGSPKVAPRRSTPSPSLGTLLPTLTLATQPSAVAPVTRPTKAFVSMPPTQLSLPTSNPLDVTETPISLPTIVSPDATTGPTPAGPLIRVALTPYRITYTMSGASTKPTPAQLDQAVATTMIFLTDNLANNFDANNMVHYDSLVGLRSSNSTDFTQIEYTAAARFLQSSTFVPVTTDLDALVLVAFQQPAVRMLVTMMKGLPADNPYSTTTQVLYEPTTSATRSPDKSSGKGASTGIVTAVLAAFLVTGAAALYRWGGACATLRKKYKKAPQREKPDEPALDSASDCTSSVGSKDIADDGGHCCRIIDEDESVVNFLDGDDIDSVVDDPLFHPPSDEELRGSRRCDSV